MSATTTLAHGNTVMSPSNGLFVNHSHRRLRLGLSSTCQPCPVPSLPGSSPYLKTEVSLLETGTSHGLCTRPLASRPGANSVGRLVHFGGFRFVNGGRCCRLGSSFELSGRGGESSLREPHVTRKGANCSQLGSSHGLNSKSLDICADRWARWQLLVDVGMRREVQRCIGPSPEFTVSPHPEFFTSNHSS